MKDDNDIVSRLVNRIMLKNATNDEYNPLKRKKKKKPYVHKIRIIKKAKS